MHVVVISDSAPAPWMRTRWQKNIDPLRPHATHIAYRNILSYQLGKKVYDTMARKRKNPAANCVRTSAGFDIPANLYATCSSFMEELAAQYRPENTLLILAGELANLFFRDAWGLKTWRGSLETLNSFRTITTLSAEQVAKRVQWIPLMRADMTRAYAVLTKKLQEEQQHQIHLLRTVEGMREGIERIKNSLLHINQISADIETYLSDITMIGVGHGKEEAIVAEVFAFRDARENLLSFEDECEIVGKLRALFASAGTIVGQNFTYDKSYLFRKWGLLFGENQIFDLMIASHVLDPQQEKSLDVQASLHLAHYKYWKTEGKNWHIMNDLRKEMLYNAKDIIYTHQLGFILQRKILAAGFSDQLVHQQYCSWTTFRWNMDGICVDEDRAAELRAQIITLRDRLEKEVIEITGLRPSQTGAFIQQWYEDMNLQEQINRKTGRRTIDDEAVAKLRSLYPHLAFLFDRILQYRSFKIFSDNLTMQRDQRGRLTTQYNPAGTDTFRFSSTSNSFNEGGNLQNITKGDPDSGIPNMRSMLCADRGWVGFESDLAQADAQIVAWDSDDEILMHTFLNRLDLHMENARMIYDLPAHITKKDPEGAAARQKAKAGVHATNYGVAAKTLAQTLKCSVAAAHNFIARWFHLHPKIAQWQKAVIHELETKRIVRNIYGFQVKWLGEVNFHAHHAALAWRPQSCVAILIMKIAQVWEREFDRRVLRIQLQTHDSLRYQIREDMVDTVLPRLKELAAAVEVPYPKPLIIPMDYIESHFWGEKE